MRNCAERQENGYMVNVNGVLLHIKIFRIRGESLPRW